LPRTTSLRIALSGLLLTSAVFYTPPAAQAQGLVGAYLAAREAGSRNDFTQATPYLERLLLSDPGNTVVLEGATVSALSGGQFERAVGRARELIALEPDNRAATLVLLIAGFDSEEYDAALRFAENSQQLHPLVYGLAQAWAQMGQGRMSEALEMFDSVSDLDGMTAFALYCRALALALVGDVEGALALLEDTETGTSQSLNRRGFLAYAQLLGLSERFDDALALLDTVFEGSSDPEVARMRAAFSQQTALPFDLISTPAEGFAEVIAVLANAMRSAGNTREALLYAQGAVRINPDLLDAQLMIGQIFEDLEQPDLALAAYGAVPRESVFDMSARMGRAQVLEATGANDQAIEELTALVDEYPQSFVAMQFLGDFQRREQRHDAAIMSYSTAIQMMQDRGIPPTWQTWFSRAVSYERTGQWQAAEADFRAALQIEPDQPTVLNYLGYSLVERGEKLDEALDMIERAVAGQPDSGFIVDSLAWALYRLGRYDEALPHMERAVELEPTDPVLNDHLGDIYWAVGRQREAQFQWRRALSFGPSDDMDSAVVRRKLEVGLDVVRVEQGEPPLRPADG